VLIKNFISGARLGREIKFDTYATITFDENDKRHDFPIVTELESFTRGKTNGIIFNMENTSLNEGVFTKCVIYQTLCKNEGSYGYILFNEETGQSTHSFNIEFDTNELIKHIYKSISSIPQRPMIEKMLAESLAIKNIA
jgi:hypothetical protein